MIDQMKEIRCRECKRFLMKALWGEFEIKCPNSRCKTINKVKLSSHKYLLTAKPQQATIKS